MVLTFLNKHRHIGLLVLRIGIGLMFMVHGAPKLLAARRNGRNLARQWRLSASGSRLHSGDSWQRFRSSLAEFV